MNDIKSTVLLNNGIEMPVIGLGVFKIGDGNPVKDVVSFALKSGYRAIDTASVYGNETGVGEGIRESGINREEVFVTSKAFTNEMGYQETIEAYNRSLEKLQISYLDLYLIHWPKEGKYLESYGALVDLYKEGKVKAIGVSNFHISHLKALMGNFDILPTVNQIELHPLLQQQELRDFCSLNNIAVEAWSPLMKGALDIPLLQEIGKKHNKSVAQIILRWHIQNNIIVIPKSVHFAYIKENLEIFDFMLSDKEMDAIATLNQNKRFGPNPDNFDF
jgi:diketogulonate reductase-like aldo/keto reductase